MTDQTAYSRIISHLPYALARTRGGSAASCRSVQWRLATRSIPLHPPHCSPDAEPVVTNRRIRNRARSTGALPSELVAKLHRRQPRRADRDYTCCRSSSLDLLVEQVLDPNRGRRAPRQLISD